MRTAWMTLILEIFQISSFEGIVADPGNEMGVLVAAVPIRIGTHEANRQHTAHLAATILQ